jgi:hypothetical protein
VDAVLPRERERRLLRQPLRQDVGLQCIVSEQMSR